MKRLIVSILTIVMFFAAISGCRIAWDDGDRGRDRDRDRGEHDSGGRHDDRH